MLHHQLIHQRLKIVQILQQVNVHQILKNPINHQQELNHPNQLLLVLMKIKIQIKQQQSIINQLLMKQIKHLQK
jgi:hypothetical protein